MDADRIRAAFVRVSLERAKRDGGSLAARTAHEFRRYLDWHGDKLPAPEQHNLSHALSELERRYPASRFSDGNL